MFVSFKCQSYSIVFEAVIGYAIIGRGITEDKDYKTAANKFWKVVQERT